MFLAQFVPELSAALNDEHFVDRVHHDLRRDFIQRFPELLVVGIGLQVELLPFLAEGSHLALFQLGLREDLAIYFDEDLLEDFGTGASHDESHRQEYEAQLFEHKY